jgi:hypothetical protein
LPVIRLYYVDDEAHFIVRRADGTPMSVPAWMTQSEAACLDIVSTARLPVLTLLELRRLVVTYLSSWVHDAHQEDHDAATTSDTTETALPGVAGKNPRREASTGNSRTAERGVGAMDANSCQDDQPGGRK